jgi:cytochrome c biogenesis protein CcmG/thiol:disulfide interchange protein DsbE
MRRLVYVLPVVLLIALGIAFAVGLGRDPQKLPSALIDKPVPTFVLPPLDGRSDGFASTDLAGKVSLVNVWASWCLPCRAEQPILMGIAAAGIPVFGVNYKDKPDDAKRFLADLGNPFSAIGADRDGRVAIDFGVYGYPETFIVDRTGIIRYKHVGPINKVEWEQTLRPIVEELKRR